MLIEREPLFQWPCVSTIEIEADQLTLSLPHDEKTLDQCYNARTRVLSNQFKNNENWSTDEHVSELFDVYRIFIEL